MPAPKLRPVEPSTTTRPPVMYSQPWSPTPSTTALAPGGGAVEHGVADDHVLLGGKAGVLGRMHRQHAAGEALAGVVVRLARERERHAGHQPGAEALAGGAGQSDLDRALPQAG